MTLNEESLFNDNMTDEDSNQSNESLIEHLKSEVNSSCTSKYYCLWKKPSKPFTKIPWGLKELPKIDKNII